MAIDSCRKTSDACQFTEKCKGRKVGGDFEVPRLRAFILEKNPACRLQAFHRCEGTGETLESRRNPEGILLLSELGDGWVSCFSVCVASGAFCSLSCTFKEMEKVVFLFLMLGWGGGLSQERPGFPDTDSQHFRSCEIKTSKQKRCL